MFRAVREFDGSDSEKCITLCPGDKLTAVHVVDEVWYLGHNERTGETGAFPVSCVVDEEAKDYEPQKPVSSTRGQRSGSVSGLDDHITSIIDETYDRSRSMSTNAINFDVNRLRATKPEKTFSLRPTLSLKDVTNIGKSNDASVDISNVFSTLSLPTQDSDPPSSTNTASPVCDELEAASKHVVVPTSANSADVCVDISGTTLLHSLSVPESVSEWYESSFEDSFQQEFEQSGSGDVITREPPISEVEIDTGADKHEYEPVEERTCTSEKVVPTNNNTLVYVSSAVCALLFVGIVFLSLVTVYKIPLIAACVILVVTVLCMVILFVLKAAFRCVISLMFPSSVSWVGQYVLYGMILCLILNGPILNIAHNLKQAGSNIVCAVDLLAHQQEALNRKSSALADNIMKHIDEQRATLMDINANISSDFDHLESTLTVVDDHLDELTTNMTTIYQTCLKPLETAEKRCLGEYCSRFNTEYLKHRCEIECKKIEGLRTLCNDLNIGGNIAETATQSKLILERAKDNMKIDLQVSVTNGSIELANTTTTTRKSSRSVENAVDDDLDESTSVFEHLVNVTIICMSLSLPALLVWSFNVYKHYLSTDGYNNTYINATFREFDSNVSESDIDPILPLQDHEKKTYIDIKSPTLSKQQRSCLKHDVSNLVMQILVFAIIFMLDCILYYILNTVRQSVNLNSTHAPSRHFQVNIIGPGPVTHFYESIFKGLGLYEDFMTKLNATFDRCNYAPTNIVETYNIAGFVVLYIVLICVIILQGYSPRLQGLIFAIYNPTQEQERMNYLRTRFHVERENYSSMFPHMVRSRNKKMLKKRELSLWGLLKAWLPCLQKCSTNDITRFCTGCGVIDQHLSAMSPCYCTPESFLEICYCEACKAKLNDQCPICITATQ